MRFRWIVLLWMGWMLGISGSGMAQTPGLAKTGDGYVLAPDVLAKAVHYSNARVALDFLASGWGIAQLLLLLSVGVAYRMRNVAVNLTRNRWTQCSIFLFQLLVVLWVLNLPLKIFGHHLSLAYGQSVQGWGSWLGDQAKSFGITWGIAVMLAIVLQWTIRRFPRAWWLGFWAFAVCFVVAGIFISPYVIDPLFNKFEPLQASNSALVQQLEGVVRRSGLTIPPERMFLMKASAKVTGINAYVTGFGASKRVVVWDTTIAKSSPDEISFIFGHEMGHYVLNHIVLGVAFAAAWMLVGFYAGSRLVAWLIARYGRVWRVHSLQDWGALVVMLLVLSVLGFAAEPIANGFSRWEEHAADVYGQEAVYGVVADPQAAVQGGFQRLGETYLDDPHPNALVVFWTFSHPSIQSRATFGRDYDPWAAGQTPKYFKK